MIVFALIVIVLAHSFYKKNKNKAFLSSLKSDDLKIVSKDGLQFIVFEDDHFYLSSIKNGESPIKISGNIFVPSEKGLVMPNIHKTISGFTSEQMQSAVEYSSKHGGKTAKAIVAIKLNPNEASQFGLAELNTTLCALKNGNFYFNNDKSFVEYRLVDIDFQPKFKNTYTTKTKGRAGSALVGGMIAGPVGAMVGGSRNKKSTTTSNANEIDSTAILTVSDEKLDEYKISLNAKTPFINFLKINFLHKINLTSKSDSSPADEIAKYKTLADQNIITKDEFEAKKKQLLNL